MEVSFLLILQMKNEGPLSLFRGITPVMIRAFPANAVSIVFCVLNNVYAIYVLFFCYKFGILAPKQFSVHLEILTLA